MIAGNRGFIYLDAKKDSFYHVVQMGNNKRTNFSKVSDIESISFSVVDKVVICNFQIKKRKEPIEILLVLWKLDKVKKRFEKFIKKNNVKIKLNRIKVR